MGSEQYTGVRYMVGLFNRFGGEDFTVSDYTVFGIISKEVESEEAIVSLQLVIPRR